MNFILLLAEANPLDVNKSGGVDIGDLVIIGTVIGGILTAFQLIIKLGDRLWGANKRNSNGANPTQSVACSVAHESLKESLQRMSDGIDRFRESVQTSHQTILLNQREIVTELRMLKK